MQSTTDKKKVKLFQIKKLKTCLKLMINKLARFTTRSDNAFCFTHSKHHLIKLKLYNNWSGQAVNSALCEIQRKQSNLLTFKN